MGVSPVVENMTKGQLMSLCLCVCERGVFEMVTCDWPVFMTDPETVQDWPQHNKIIPSAK